MKIKLSDIYDVFTNIRRSYDRTQIESLADLLSDPQFDLEPIVVTPHNRQKGKYLLVSGFHRVQAYRAAGRAEIPAKIIPIEEALEAAIKDNAIGIVPLSAAERREAASKLLRAGFSHEQVASITGAPLGWVRRLAAELEEKKQETLPIVEEEATPKETTEETTKETPKRRRGKVSARLVHGEPPTAFAPIRGPLAALITLLNSFDTRLGFVIQELEQLDILKRQVIARDYVTVKTQLGDLVALFRQVYFKIRAIHNLLEGDGEPGHSEPEVAEE